MDIRVHRTRIERIDADLIGFIRLPESRSVWSAASPDTAGEFLWAKIGAKN
jgi:hypothetical protein